MMVTALLAGSLHLLASAAGAAETTLPPICAAGADRRGDAWCDEFFNTAACDWDGGDCCALTCNSTATQNCGEAVNNTHAVGFLLCRDPLAACPPDVASDIGNGYCDNVNNTMQNTAACGWDGGDCCAQTCNSTAEHECGFNVNNDLFIGFGFCIDPHVCTADPAQLGDGLCVDQEPHNTHVCGWDGGDCCSDTCVSSNFTCGFSAGGSPVGFSGCHDPNACQVINHTRLGNGFCDDALPLFNTRSCGWDGGDCCIGTCQSTAQYTCGQNGNVTVGYLHCRDPLQHNESSDGGGGGLDLSDCVAYNLADVGNAFCDEGVTAGSNLNVASCHWDGGDCCPQTCLNEVEAGTGNVLQQCGQNLDGEDIGFFCLDPLILGAHPLNESSCPVQHPSFLGDGFCDGDEYNVPGCQWDGGDCCNETCVSNDAYQCGSGHGFDCKDPDTADFGTCHWESILTNVARVGNGRCDETGVHPKARLNTRACGWDGGDCCPDTCTDCHWQWYTCLNPNSSSYGAVGECVVEYTSYLGDGACDIAGGYNTDACGWDAGDCCPSTCRQRGEDSYTCGARAFFCIDPGAYENTGYTGDCPAIPHSYVGDGYCDTDEEQNSAQCGWDGGDCCAQTCTSTDGYTCGRGYVFDNSTQEYVYTYVGFFNCLDPQHTPLTTTISTTTETTTSSPPKSVTPPNVNIAQPLTVGAIVGITCGVVAAVAALIAVLVVAIKRKSLYIVPRRRNIHPQHVPAAASAPGTSGVASGSDGAGAGSPGSPEGSGGGWAAPADGRTANLPLASNQQGGGDSTAGSTSDAGALAPSSSDAGAGAPVAPARPSNDPAPANTVRIAGDMTVMDI
eukprot:CAMPEP_0195507010 /NCGR_PEP_ID=MMETSP0794_2-20130614/543_1 /TAXON_ID=515487 /ORGANISM="Stephanopyxis turris, Strain CCMP 815" /LENGTH=842 /DNA_ID=CAMNT_0040633541 /DNA_START=258 /DNA_END=2786 /DNA_ORIENTATION=+